MITVIIAGGSGTRLWPLSTPHYPKHLLRLIGESTMLQQAYDRARQLGETIYVVTEASHSDHVREQLSNLPEDAFLIEPGRRGTAHCIIYALDVIARKHDKDEPIAFIHADHHIRDIEGFVNSFKIASNVSSEKGLISLIGIEPTNPATGFGYIERGKIIDGYTRVHSVESFKEKPDFDTAKKYVESGKYLWNCGYFVGSVNIFEKELNNVAPKLASNYKKLTQIDDSDKEKYAETYLSFGNEVIDVALIEKSKALAVVPASFDWMDVGNFKDLHDANQSDQKNNYFRGENIHHIETENAFVRNEEPEKPVAVIGLDNIVVINTSDGILVARKDLSPRVGEIAKKI